MKMDLFGLLQKADMNTGVEKAKTTPGAILLDVRTREEYAQRHVPGSVNLPLDELNAVGRKIPDKATPVFVHCLSGARSAQAQRILTQMGYTAVTNIGGISSYRGKTEGSHDR